MKGTRHSEEQIIAILKQGEAGLTTAELCRQHGITEQTYYRWKELQSTPAPRPYSTPDKIFFRWRKMAPGSMCVIACGPRFCFCDFRGKEFFNISHACLHQSATQGVR
jgi:hypothetical protein